MVANHDIRSCFGRSSRIGEPDQDLVAEDSGSASREMEAALPALGRRRRIVRADRRGRRQTAALPSRQVRQPLTAEALRLRHARDRPSPAAARKSRSPSTQRSKTSWALSSVAAGVADFRVPKLPCARNGVDPHVETIRPSKSIPKQLMPAWFVCITSLDFRRRQRKLVQSSR
jgi:hypothetical protein